MNFAVMIYLLLHIVSVLTEVALLS